MASVLRVSLRPALKREVAPDAWTQPLLDVRGPYACVGAPRTQDGLAMPVRPGSSTLFGPRGACLLGAGRALWVCDTGHHRLLGWRHAVTYDDQPADWVLGQPDFASEGRNARGRPSASSLNVPTGITPIGDGFALADAWNHRVLIWLRAPREHNVPADLVLGQPDFDRVEANRGSEPAQDSLFWPYGLLWDGAHLWVADTGNRRVLMWDGLPLRNGQPADLVLGQPGFGTRNENGGGDPDARSMRWPHALARWGERLCVGDAGNNRIMVWPRVPARDNTAAEILLGQTSARAVDNNQSLYWPTAGSLNMPYGIAAAGDWLLVADTANSRLTGWHADDAATGAAARALTGQPHFAAKGDNRWQLAQRDSVCWPYGLAACDDQVVVADSGNNRVLLWRLAPEVHP